MDSQHILHIDDDPDDLQLFSSAVYDINSSVVLTSFQSSIKALEYLDDCMILPYVIFLDINMPLLSGPETALILKAKRTFAHIPIIILPTSFDEILEKELKKIGVRECLIKPNSLTELENLIRPFVITSI